MDYIEASNVNVKIERCSDDEEESESFREMVLPPQLLQNRNIKVTAENSNSPSSSTAMKKKINGITLGKTFKSFADVSDAVREYELKEQVHLTAKYFRRIAANPKPSNKEDYMLTVEERKCFVYRWVDFCCTYFDGRITSPSEINGDGAGPSIGYSAKECPVRIRFQLRPAEKDLIVSTLKETHDHDNVNDGQAGSGASQIAQGSELKTGAINCRKSGSLFSTGLKLKSTRPPPPLNAIPSSINSVHRNPSVVRAMKSTAKFQRNPGASRLHQNTHPIPRPPPLKRANFVETSTSTAVQLQSPSRGCLDERLNQQPSANNISPANVSSPISQGTHTRAIITNMYNYLLRIKTEGPTNPNGIGFASSNPDLVKIIAEMTGIDPRLILQIIHGRNRNSNLSSRIQPPQPYQTTARKRNAGLLHRQQQHQHQSFQIPAKRRVFQATSSSALLKSEETCPKLKYFGNNKPKPRLSQPQSRTKLTHHRSSEDHDDYSGEMPLEVIIKSEPAEFNPNNEDDFLRQDVHNNTLIMERELNRQGQRR